MKLTYMSGFFPNETLKRTITIVIEVNIIGNKLITTIADLFNPNVTEKEVQLMNDIKEK